MLRFAIRLDALISLAFGVLLLAGGPVLGELLGAPVGLLWTIGAVTLVYAAALWLVQRRAGLSPRAAWTIVAANVAWTAASVLVVVFGSLPLTSLGVAFVLLQAAVVGVLADLQFFGARAAYARR